MPPEAGGPRLPLLCHCMPLWLWSIHCGSEVAYLKCWEEIFSIVLLLQAMFKLPVVVMHWLVIFNVLFFYITWMTVICSDARPWSASYHYDWGEQCGGLTANRLSNVSIMRGNWMIVAQVQFITADAKTKNLVYIHFQWAVVAPFFK